MAKVTDNESFNKQCKQIRQGQEPSWAAITLSHRPTVPILETKNWCWYPWTWHTFKCHWRLTASGRLRFVNTKSSFSLSVHFLELRFLFGTSFFIGCLVIHGRQVMVPPVDTGNGAVPTFKWCCVFCPWFGDEWASQFNSRQCQEVEPKRLGCVTAMERNLPRNAGGCFASGWLDRGILLQSRINLGQLQRNQKANSQRSLVSFLLPSAGKWRPLQQRHSLNDYIIPSANLLADDDESRRPRRWCNLLVIPFYKMPLWNLSPD